MTAQQAYDLLRSVGYQDPTALKLGDRCILGEWLPLAQLQNGGILRSKERAIRVLGEGATWDEAMAAWRLAEEKARDQAKDKT